MQLKCVRAHSVYVIIRKKLSDKDSAFARAFTCEHRDEKLVPLETVNRDTFDNTVYVRLHQKFLDPSCFRGPEKDYLF